MKLLALLYVLTSALIITLLFTYVFKQKGPWGSFWTFFIILFLAIWAADVWISPIGPVWNHIYWLRPLIFGVTLALLLIATAPNPKARSLLEKKSKEDSDEFATKVTLSVFFWLSVIIIFALILAGLLNNV